MGLFDTTADKETERALTNALGHLDHIIERAKIIREELDRHIKACPGRAFPIAWVRDFDDICFSLHNEVAKANGACLVRSTNTKD